MKKFCDLTGKVALLTRAATGIGEACAAELAADEFADCTGAEFVIDGGLAAA